MNYIFLYYLEKTLLANNKIAITVNNVTADALAGKSVTHLSMVIFLSFSDRTKILFGGHAQTVNGPLCYTSFKIFTCLNRAKKIKK